MTVNRRKKWILILTITGVALILSASIWLYGYLNPLSKRLTSSVRSAAVHGEVFTESKLIKTNEEYDLNPQGDGTMEGIYQLTPSDVKQLLSADPPLICQRQENCRASKTYYAPNNPSPYYYAKTDVIGEELSELEINIATSQVTWRITWY